MRSNARQVMERLKNKFESIKREAPVILANEGQRYFNKSFREQRYENHPWPEVERRKVGTNAYKYPKNKYLSRRTNPILVGKTRRLKNALNRSVKSHNVRRIVWGVYGVQNGGFDYASAQNFGNGRLKKRMFMGGSKGLGLTLKKKFEEIYRRRLK